MWIVRGLRHGDGLDSLCEVSQAYITTASPCLFALFMELYETKSGKMMTLYADNYDAARKFVEEYKPYGACIAPADRDEMEGIWFIVVDKYSWQFLDYVYSVELVAVRLGNMPSDFVSQYPSDWESDLFTSLDVNNSLFYTIPGHCVTSCACTLLQAVTFVKHSWVNNEVYLVSRYMSKKPSAPQTVAAYRVTFEDISKVRAFLGKLAVTYDSPLDDFIKHAHDNT